VQMSNLMARVVYDGMTIHARLELEAGNTITQGFFVVWLVFGSLSTFLLLVNLMFLFVILFFCQGIL